MAQPARRISIRDVAHAAGVSVATASKALNDTGRLAAETRARVKRVAADVGFRPNALARGLLSKRSFTVGLLTNDAYGRFTLPVMAGVSQALADHSISVFLGAVDDDPALAETHVAAMLDKQVDGIIATGKRVDRRLPVDLARLPVPVVYAFCEGTPDAVTLRSDDAHGATLAVAHLRALGRARVAHVTGPESFFSVRERAAAFRALAGDDAPVLSGPWSEAWGHEAVARLWSAAAALEDGDAHAVREPDLVALDLPSRRDRADWGDILYRTAPPTTEPGAARLVPYHLWDNRTPGEMLVWFRTR